MPDAAIPDDQRLRLQEQIAAMAPALELLPGVAIVNSVRDGSVLYMCGKGRSKLGVTLDELLEMGTGYHARFFNLEQVNEYLPLIQGMLERNETEGVCTFFQQVRMPGHDDWQWYLSAARVLFRDPDGQPLAMLTLAQHISSDLHVTHKVNRLLDELTFIRGHGRKFGGLGGRERDVLRQMAIGSSSQDIATELSISIHTVHTHRKNIRRKLNIRTQEEVYRYARAFDLV